MRKQLKEMAKVKTICGSLRPMIFVCNLFGLIPFNLDKSSNQYKVTPCGILAVVLNVTMFSVCYGLSVTSMKNYITCYLDTRISQISSVSFLSIYTVAMIIIYSSVLFKHKLLMKTINKMYLVDVKFKLINAEVSYSKLLLRSVKLIIGNKMKFIIYICSNVLFQVYTKHEQAVATFISYFYPHLILSVIVVKYLSVMDNICQRIQQLNKVNFDKINALKNTFLSHSSMV